MKYFCTFVKSKQSSFKIPNNIVLQIISSSESQRICNFFLWLLSLLSLLSETKDTSTNNVDINNNYDSMNTINFNAIDIPVTLVLKYLKNIGTKNKFSVYDKFHPTFIVNCAETLVSPAILLYKKSFK